MTHSLRKVSDHLLPICEHADEVLEYKDQLTINGRLYLGLQEHLSGLFQLQDEAGISGSLTVRVNDEAIDAEMLAEMVDNEIPFDNWQILLHKESLPDIHDTERDIWTVWFLTDTGFYKWFSELDPFNKSGSIFTAHSAIRVLICGFKNSFGGPLLAVDDIDAKRIVDDWPLHYNGPDENAVKRQVHLLAHGDTSLCPAPFLLTWGDIDSEAAKPFRLLSGKIIASCLTQEFYGNDRVVLKGTRRLELPLSVDTDTPPSAEDLSTLWEAVEWIYEERPEVRAGLIADRLSLDLADGQSLLASAARYINDSLTQSREQYKFVIQDRKDAYAKELRDLLKDVQHQAGLFSDKVRSIMNSLLRDVLAALLLISLGLFSRVGKSQDVLTSMEAGLLFKGLSVYLVVSLALQVFVHMRDLYLSKNELSYWANTTRTQLGVEDISRHLNEPIKARRHSFYGMIVILSIVYSVLALSAWNFQFILELFGVIGGK